MPKLIRITTWPLSLKYLIPGQMRFMNENGFEVVMVSADGKELADVKKNEGCRHEIVPMTRQITPLADFKSLMKLYRLFKREKPDIVHSHTPKAGLLAMLAAKLAGVKVRVHTVAGLRFMTSTGGTRKVLVAMEKLTASAATNVWPNSFSLLEYIRKNNLASDEKLEVIGMGSSNGINLGRFSVASLNKEKLNEIRALINYDSNLTYMLSVGRIVKDKGIDELLKAFTELHKSNDKLRLVLLGAFEEELDPITDDAKRILKEHPAIIHIEWNDAVEYFMHLADMLVHPSHREGFPNVLLQAGAMLCPIVCSRIEGNVDIVQHEDTGLIFQVHNQKDLRDKLAVALSSPEKMDKMAVRLRDRIERHFDQKLVHQNLRKRYLELLGDRKITSADRKSTYDEKSSITGSFGN